MYSSNVNFLKRSTKVIGSTLLLLGSVILPTVVSQGSTFAAAPTLSETVTILVEGGTTTEFPLAGSNLDGATLAESDDNLNVALRIDEYGSMFMEVTLIGDISCPDWDSCQTDVTVTTTEGSDTFTLYRVDSNWTPTIDFSVNWTVGQTTASANFVEGPTMEPPFSSGLWNNGNIFLTLKPVRTGELGYDADPEVCGGYPNDCVYGSNYIESVTATEYFEGLTPGTPYSASAKLQASVVFTGTSNFDAFGGTASPFTAQTDAPTARTISLADATTTADQSVTLAATVSAGDGTVTYTATDGTATGCGISGTALTVNTPGTCTVTASVAANGAYASATTNATITFNAATRTISLADATTTADQSVTLAATVSAGDGTVTYTATDGTATGCGISGTALTVNTPGTCTVTASVAANGAYASATTNATITFNAATRTISLADATTTADQSVTLAATVSAGDGTVTYTATDGTATGCGISGTALTVNTPGTCTVTASVAANGAYASATTNATITFNAATRTISLADATTTADQSVTLAATVSAGDGTVTYTATDGTATGCGISGTALTVNTPGTCTVTASVAANGAYASATTNATITFNAAQTETTTTTTTTAPATTTTIAPERDSEGGLLELEPGEVGSIVDGRVEVVDVRTVDTVVELFSDEFSLNVGAKTSNAEAVTPTADGRLVVNEDASVEVSGEGFEPGGQVEVWLFSEPQLLGVAEVASDGTFSGSFSLPSGVEVGTHTLQADGKTADGSTRTLNLGIEVVPDDPSEADGVSLKGPDGTFYELEPATAAILVDDNDDGVATASEADYSETNGQISVTTDSELSLLIAPSAASEQITTTTQSTASIIFEQGSEVIARGTGYEPGAKVEVWVASTPRLLGIAEVGEDGNYELRIPVPTDLPVGGHTIQTEGLASDGLSKAVSVGITVQSQPTAGELPATGQNSSLPLALSLLLVGLVLVMARRRHHLES